MLCLNNGLQYPEVDRCIQSLTKIEERLCAPCHVFQSIWQIWGPQGQHKAKGGIVNVPVNLDTTLQSLPRPLNNSHVIHVKIAQKLEYLSNYMSGNVRIKKINNASKALTSKDFYIEEGIILSHDWSVKSKAEQEAYASEDNMTSSDKLYSHDEQDGSPGTRETLLTSDEDIRIAPAEGYRPTSILMNPNAECMAFVKLYGGNKLNPIFNGKPIPYSEVAKSIAMRYDRRAAMRPDYLLYMAKKLELLKLRSNVNVCLRKKNLRDGHVNTAEKVLNDSFVQGLLQYDVAYQLSEGVRGSGQHWKGEKKKVRAMIRQFDLPSTFLTMSAAEAHWPELIVQLKKSVDNEDIKEEDVIDIPQSERARLIQSDPITCARHFDKRMRAIKQTWNSKGGPFGARKVLHWYWRIKFEQRG